MRAGEGERPVSSRQFEDGITGVTRLKHGRAILHRTPSKFVSFAWGSKRMALAVPRGGNSVVWPHYASYLGLVNQKDGSQRNATLADLHYDIHPDRFTVTGTLRRLDGEVSQSFAIASLERTTSRTSNGCGRKTVSASRKTGVVGHEYPLDANTRTLYGRFGRKTSSRGNRAVHQLKTDWLNIGGHVGYVVRRNGGRQNVMRYHDQTDGHGRVPKLQEWLSLIGEEDPASYLSTDDWACVVTFLNQSPTETAEWAGRVRFDVDGHTATCHLDDDTIRADFTELKTRIIQPSP